MEPCTGNPGKRPLSFWGFILCLSGSYLSSVLPGLSLPSARQLWHGRRRDMTKQPDATEASNSCFVRPCARPFWPICSMDMRVQHMSHSNNAHPNGSAHDAASLNARSARRSDGHAHGAASSLSALRARSAGGPHAVQHACRCSLHCARSRSTMPCRASIGEANFSPPGTPGQRILLWLRGPNHMCQN